MLIEIVQLMLQLFQHVRKTNTLQPNIHKYVLYVLFWNEISNIINIIGTIFI